MEINIYDLPGYCRIDNNSLIITSKDSFEMPGYNKIKIDIPIKLELHLRNSEVVGIPITLGSKLKLISHSFTKPLQGTHNTLFLTFLNEGGNMMINENDPLVTFTFVSKHYWRLMLRKDIEGIISTPIKINHL